ncbi:F0F1 ATP synthase subunit gamma [Aliiglaciecola sp. LCG003]|uniref:F0F1 ATP synthase subunit gamma n=1 Tax=Aliiglaciecola sp. LCG003 TaxID=3053655 RepID=UPI0025730D60|nr:F0F1 ATP synthase subunit gamma [Aliiglaciecola sp. LCG003]WJG07704.1 F0F1 ATP synthase subunit gamma [Aliiglaciecola sp. LCG003]
MTQALSGLQRKIGYTHELQSVVRTMKALAAANIVQFEDAVNSLIEYYYCVQLGLNACFNQPLRSIPQYPFNIRHQDDSLAVIVFGSDQGLVGRFNENLAEFSNHTLSTYQTKKHIWCVGERVLQHLSTDNIQLENPHQLPSSIDGIAELVGELLVELEKLLNSHTVSQVMLIYNSPISKSSYAPKSLRLLPLDKKWRKQVEQANWPKGSLPELLNDREKTFLALIKEYLYVAIYRACAESLASENASRLSGMLRAEKNIENQLHDLTLQYQQIRQQNIDQELFDLILGNEALTQQPKR